MSSEDVEIAIRFVILQHDAVIDNDSNVLFCGKTEDVVKWLEDNPSEEPRWVVIGKIMDSLTASEYLDLAT